MTTTQTTTQTQTQTQTPATKTVRAPRAAKTDYTQVLGQLRDGQLQADARLNSLEKGRMAHAAALAELLESDKVKGALFGELKSDFATLAQRVDGALRGSAHRDLELSARVQGLSNALDALKAAPSLVHAGSVPMFNRSANKVALEGPDKDALNAPPPPPPAQEEKADKGKSKSKKVAAGTWTCSCGSERKEFCTRCGTKADVARAILAQREKDAKVAAKTPAPSDKGEKTIAAGTWTCSCGAVRAKYCASCGTSEAAARAALAK